MIQRARLQRDGEIFIATQMTSGMIVIRRLAGGALVEKLYYLKDGKWTVQSRFNFRRWLITKGYEIHEMSPAADA